MVIQIGNKIKELRKKANVSQESFADYLGITAQAVSKWEVGGCYPDLELLPSIAHFFNISIDELLCYDRFQNKEKIEKILSQGGPERSKSWFNGTLIELFRNGIQEFPNSYELLFALAKTLCLTREPYITKESKAINLKESITICNRILSDCTDDDLRLPTIKVLAQAYNNLGHKESAIETANKLPLAKDSRDMVLSSILEDDAKSTLIADNFCMLSDLFEYLIDTLANSKYKSKPKDRIKLYKKIIAFEKILHEDEDYIYETLRLRATYFWLAKDYLILNELDHAMDCIENFAKYSIAFDSLPTVSNYSSIVYHNQSCSKHRALDIENTVLDSKNRLLGDSIFTPLKSNSRFKAVISNLEKNLG